MDSWTFYQDTQGMWRWRRTAANGQVVGASSEGYRNRSDCEAIRASGYQVLIRQLRKFATDAAQTDMRAHASILTLVCHYFNSGAIHLKIRCLAAAAGWLCGARLVDARQPSALQSESPRADSTGAGFRIASERCGEMMGRMQAGMNWLRGAQSLHTGHGCYDRPTRLAKAN